MKNLERILLKGCAYTVLLLCCFYLFASLANLEGHYMPAGRFFTLLLFGFIISVSELLYNLFNFKKWLRGLLHYLILLSSFFIVFIISGNLVVRGPATVFIAIIIFTLLYFVILFTVHILSLGISKADSKKPVMAKNKSDKKSEYIPRYKD